MKQACLLALITIILASASLSSVYASTSNALKDQDVADNNQPKTKPGRFEVKQGGLREPVEFTRQDAFSPEDIKTGKSKFNRGWVGKNLELKKRAQQMHGLRYGRSKSKAAGFRSRKYDEHLEWLSKNYPDEARVLVELRRTDPEAYERQMELSLKKYRAVIVASKRNPELAEILKQQIVLRKQRDIVLADIRVATDENKKSILTQKLAQIMGEDFALVAKMKQLEHQQLLKRFEKLQQEVSKSESDVKKWGNPEFRNEKVKAHIEDLVREKESPK